MGREFYKINFENMDSTLSIPERDGLFFSNNNLEPGQMACR